jgi:hypothetical protein
MSFNSINVRPGERLEVVIGLDIDKPLPIEGVVTTVFDNAVDIRDIHDIVHRIPYNHIRTKLRDKDLVDPPIQIHALKIEEFNTLMKFRFVIASKKLNIRTKYEWRKREPVTRVIKGILDGSISVYDLEWTKFGKPNL